MLLKHLLWLDLNGQIHYWHMTSGMHLGISKEQNNSVHAIDFHPTGARFATGGRDFKVISKYTTRIVYSVS